MHNNLCGSSEMLAFSNEKRPLKRSRLGPPDVYPQDPRQKEDELTQNNVKHGFSTSPLCADEFGSARNYNIIASKVGAYFGNIQSKKEELNTFPDSGRKRQQINTKDNFWPATARTKNAIENWFKDLAGNKSLNLLSKKAPNFNKKEEMFILLCDHNVPLMRAAWFLKLSSAYTVAVSEAKMKKRQLPDPTEEWTVTLTRFLKDQLTKLMDYYQHSSQDILMPEDVKVALRQWQYCTRLARYLYEENLLERQEMLKWILELLDRLKSSTVEDGILRLFLPLAQQYTDEFVQSELFSRRLAYLCARKLSTLAANGKLQAAKLQNAGASTSAPPATTTQNQNGGSSTNNVFTDLMQCSYHHDLIISLSSIIQAICLECPTALVWNCIGEGKSSSPLNCSPLDQLPVAPSELPMPVRGSNAYFRHQIKQAEQGVKSRSRAAESRWSSDKWKQSSDAQTTTRVLSALDSLDRHCFDRTDKTNNLDTLYNSIFPKDNPSTDNVASDECIVEILCEWAVSSVRYGEHRAMAVAMLLEKRQAFLTGESTEDDKESVSSLTGPQNAVPIYQNLLMKYLDNEAPVLEDNGSASNKTMFTNVVHLFGELIRHDAFSHDVYMCTLISRGDLYNSSAGVKPETPGDGRGSNNDDEGSLFPGMDLKPAKMEVHGHDYDDSKIDDDLDKLLQHIKEEHSMDQADSPKDVPMSNVVFGTQPSRHLLYTTHFPLPQDESSSHDCNQRHVLLYGVGKLRDDARHTVKKSSKEISKLFNKKFSIDAADGKVKKYSRNEFNFELVTSRFQSLSYFDQHVVTHQCSLIVVEMLMNFASGATNYLPVAEHIAFLFDLMELSLNINRLIELCIQIVKELPAVESQMSQKGWSTDRNYTNTLSLYVVGVLKRYHSCLLLSREQSAAVFEGLCNVVKHVVNPSDCSSAERCVLVHLCDLYTTCHLLKAYCGEPFQNAYPKIKQALYSSIQPNPTNHVYNASFMPDLFINPRRNGKIEAGWARQLNESASNRYSLVCNAIVAVAKEGNNDRLNDIALTCAELTACCNALSAEWLGAFQAMCAPATLSCYVMDLLHKIDLQNLSIHNSLAVFLSILIARHCFSIVDFITIGIPPLLARGSEIDGETGSRLSCHLLLRLFKTVECPQPGLYSGGTSPHPTEGFCMKLSCDRHLLTAQHNTIQVGPALLVLKALIIVADLSSKQSKPLKKETNKVTTPLDSGELSISDILGTSDIQGAGHDLMLLSGAGRVNPFENTASLTDFAQHVLRQITSQEWVLERCLRNPEELCQPDMLLDNMLTPKQAQRLLHMICYHSSGLDSAMDQKIMISRILENLDLWTLRISWLDLQLMFKQFSPGSPDLSQWLDTVANAAIDVFQLGSGADISKDDKAIIRKRSGNIWLVAPLVSKLPSAVQGRVLRVAGIKLESQNWSGKSREREKSSNRSSSLLSHQPFLSLVLTCLKGQDEQREDLLNSLHNQLSQYLTLSKEERLSLCEDSKGRAHMQDALQLRFSLVGGMFDTVQRSTSSTTEWSLLLLQLITHGVIDLNNNPDLFTTVIDMLATLIHSTLVSDSSDRSDENRKYYVNLMKKLKKEVGDRNSPSMAMVRQLLPLGKQQLDVIACQPVGTLTDNKGNKIAFDSIDKKQGLQISEKQKVAPWEILEGHKNPAPISWSWFGAVRVERKPLWYQDTHRLLKYHTHNLTKPASYYLDAPPLPPEDLDPVPEKPCSCVYCNQMKDDKADTPSSDTSPRGKKGIKKGMKRRKTDNLPPQPAMQQAMQQPQMPMQQSMYQGQGGGMFPCQQGAQQQPMGPQQGMGQQWGGYQQPPGQQQMMPQQQQQQQGYFPPQINQQGRFERPINQQSKAALTNMLRMRLPSHNQQFMGGQFPQQPMQQRQQQFIRQQMRPQVNMQNPMMNMYQGMQQQGGMNQNYGGYGGQQPMMAQGGMFPNFPQGGGGGAAGGGGGGGMMGMQRPGEYMPPGPCMTQQRGMTQQRPYLQQSPNVTLNNMGAGMQGPAPPYPRQPVPPQQNQMTQQQNQQFQVNQQRMRQQLMAMQQQQQQQQQGNNPNQQPALMAQLQRQSQMSYQHQPPPY